MNTETVAIGIRLRKMRKESGKTISTIARDTGISKSNLSRYERGMHQPGINILRQLAEYFEVDFDWLATGESHQEVASRVTDFPKPDTRENLDLIEVFIEAEIAAGDPVEAMNSEPLGSLFVSSSLINNAPKDYYVFRVNGQSMHPTVAHEDVVFIRKTSDWDRANRKIVAVRLEGEITLKRLQMNPDTGMILLIPINQEMETIMVNPENVRDIHLIGELKTIIRRF